MKKLFIVLLGALLIGSGCGGTEGKEENFDEDELAFPEAAFTMEPQQATIGEEFTFTVKVTEANEPIDDADVSFEFWMEGQAEEDHEMIPVEHDGEGVYTLEKAFDQTGTYFMYYHVDANGMHMMDKREFVVIE